MPLLPYYDSTTESAAVMNETSAVELLQVVPSNSAAATGAIAAEISRVPVAQDTADIKRSVLLLFGDGRTGRCPSEWILHSDPSVGQIVKIRWRQPVGILSEFCRTISIFMLNARAIQHIF